MRSILLVTMVLTVVASLFITAGSHAGGSTNYRVVGEHLASGAGPMVSPSYRLQGTLGLTLSSCAEAGSYALVEGCGRPVWRYLFLPLILK